MSTSSRKRPAIWFVFTTLLVVVACGVVLAKKPVKPPEPDPAPVKYRILWVDPWEDMVLHDINDNLTVVGKASFSDAPSRAVIMDVMPSNPGPPTVHFLEDFVDLPSGWAYLQSASKVNNAGLVFGSYVDDCLGGYFVCDTSVSPPYPIQEIPLGGLIGLQQKRVDMNEAGDVLYSPYDSGTMVALRNQDGLYQAIGLPSEVNEATGINDATPDHSVQVVGELDSGQGCVYELVWVDGAYSFVQVCTFDGSERAINNRTINDNGLVAHAVKTKGLKFYAARYALDTEISQIITDLPRSESSDINSAGQICGYWDYKTLGFIYDPLKDQSWSLDDLVYANNPEDETLWFAQPSRRPNAITNPVLNTGFPAMIGGVYGSDRAFILLPEPPDTP